MAVVELTLLTRPGCHLCDDARGIIGEVLTEVRASAGPGSAEILLSELSILSDPQLLDTYAEEIPVLLINGSVHTIWRVDPARLSTALTAALKELT
jgi:hypothetical protein